MCCSASYRPHSLCGCRRYAGSFPLKAAPSWRYVRQAPPCEAPPVLRSAAGAAELYLQALFQFVKLRHFRSPLYRILLWTSPRAAAQAPAGNPGGVSRPKPLRPPPGNPVSRCRRRCTPHTAPAGSRQGILSADYPISTEVFLRTLSTAGESIARSCSSV